ncbi:MAG TPA: hypothetical protein VGR02_17470 [Thermoanaerobaculia bacterium]|jgi:hypothetical protein|nr:hypothetical protein [Thermoanaerobaculia bacterium]
MSPRRIAAAAVFAILVVLSVEKTLLRLPFIDRTPLRISMETSPDRSWYPAYPRFLAEVRRRTPPGARIALVVPMPTWETGYDYAFFRASYFLAGREVLPILTRDGKPFGDNVRNAQYLAAWGVNARGGRELWRGNGGVLLQR